MRYPGQESELLVREDIYNQEEIDGGTDAQGMMVTVGDEVTALRQGAGERGGEGEEESETGGGQGCRHTR
jgi:hypothetical protein